MRTTPGRSRTQCAVERSADRKHRVARGVTAHSNRPELLAALLDGLPELDLLRRSLTSAVVLRRHDLRTSLLARVAKLRPRLLVAPFADRASVPTDILIATCRRLFPDVPVLMLSAGVPSYRGALLSALRSDARVLLAPSSRELATAVALGMRGIVASLAPGAADRGESRAPARRPGRTPRGSRIVASGAGVPVEGSDRLVLVGMAVGQRITLDAFGRRVWALLGKEPTLPFLIEALRDGQVRADRLAEDVTRLLARWQSLGVIAWR